MSKISEPPCEYLESWLVVKWSHEIRCGPLQHADITLELSQHFYEIFMNVKPRLKLHPRDKNASIAGPGSSVGPSSSSNPMSASSENPTITIILG
jgi:hypothetical protein